MRKNSKYVRALRAVHHYSVIFLIVAFVVTCCTMLFVSVMARSMGIEFTEENLNTAAKRTFLNVVVISLLFTVIDAVRRKITVDRPVKRITEAAERMARGDFSVRISVSRRSDDEFQRIAECFNRLAEELAGTETLRTDFIANVSHEMKTPLAVMQNYATMLQGKELSEQTRKEYAAKITEASRQLADLVTNILKLNKLENQQITPTEAVYDLGEQLCECLLGFEDVWEKKEIEIDTELEENVLVCADAEMMSLVWNNLFSNAFKFTDAQGKVRVRLFADGAFAVVQVTDTGCGISPQVGAHMFDKFYQGDLSHATQGNGLGLALVKRVIDLTGSAISVESELSVGSTFTVRMRREQDGNL